MAGDVGIAERRCGWDRAVPAATVCAGAGVWAWLVPHVAGSLGSRAGFSNVDAWLAAMVLPVLGAVTAYHHRIAGARRPAGVGWVVSNGIVASLLLHLAFHGDQGAAYLYGWAPAVGEAAAVLVLGTAVPHAVADAVEGAAAWARTRRHR
nr:hypothetical protein KPHV_87530 [Kitasatospora purpeofusca]